MDLTEFEKNAHRAWNEIPAEYKQGIDGLIIEQDAHTHADHTDFYTLGECVTEAYPSDFGGPDTIRSAVVLYYGSFRGLAANDESFDWQQEIHETLLHELQHHLEHLATEDGLEDFDYAVEENYRRVEGEPFDPLFFHGGELIAPHTYRVEDDVFIELQSPTIDALQYRLDWQGETYRVELPASSADILFAVIEQEMPDVAGDLCIVRIRQKSALAKLRAAFSRDGYSLEEVLVSAEAA